MAAPARAQLQDLGLSATCAEVLHHLWDYLDEQITPSSAERLRAHIANCDTCRKYENYQECFLQAVAGLRQEFGAPESLRERLADRLKGQGCSCWDKVRK